MNALDERILAIIEKNSRVGIKELAVLLGTNEEEVINSMERLENNGIICGYHTMIQFRDQQAVHPGYSDRYNDPFYPEEV